MPRDNRCMYMSVVSVFLSLGMLKYVVYLCSGCDVMFSVFIAAARV